LKINLPNALTLLRIFLVPFLLVVLLTKFEGRETVGLVIFLFAVSTDFFDGWLARRRGEITTLGTLLDPIADKLLISAAFVSLVELGLAPAWMVVVILGREFAVSGLRAIASGQGIVISASRSGSSSRSRSPPESTTSRGSSAGSWRSRRHPLRSPEAAFGKGTSGSTGPPPGT
jgi:CDP-diacylglycerol--glycerol-3-phosphate 3-phosphatidyltransferase